MVLLSETATEHLKKLLKERNTPDWGLRVGVKSGGCSGLEYDLDFAEKAEEGDQTFESDGVKVFVDTQSFKYLNGTTLDFSTDLLTGGFKFVNPNAARSCSCGTSFSV